MFLIPDRKENEAEMRYDSGTGEGGRGVPQLDNGICRFRFCHKTDLNSFFVQVVRGEA